MHLHGFRFRVVGMKKYGDKISVEEVLKDDATGSGIPRKLHKAPKKDTVVVMDGGVTIVRFVADNPGYWFFHCHMDYHLATGQAMIFHVGPDELIEKPPERWDLKCDSAPKEIAALVRFRDSWKKRKEMEEEGKEEEEKDKDKDKGMDNDKKTDKDNAMGVNK